MTHDFGDPGLWWSSPPSASTSPTDSTTPRTRWPPPSPPTRSRPKTAVLLSGILNLIGAFLSVEVALTVTNAVVKIQNSDGRAEDRTARRRRHGAAADRAGRAGRRHRLEPAHLAARPAVEFVARAVRRPDRRTIAGLGWAGVNWNGDGTKLDGVVGKVLLPARDVPGDRRSGRRGRHLADLPGHRRVSPSGSPSRASVGPDRQRLAGLAGARHQRRAEDHGRDHARADRRRGTGPTPAASRSGSRCPARSPSPWAPTSAAGGSSVPSARAWWRSPRRRAWPPQSASAAVILASSHLGFALSTTHVATGSILGSGVGRPGAQVRWRVAGRMVAAWLITLPAAGLVGALMWWIGDLIGGLAGALAIFVLLLAASAGDVPALAPDAGRPPQRQRRVGRTRRPPSASPPARELRGSTMHNLGFALDGAWQVLRRRPAARRRAARPVRARHPLAGLRRRRRRRGARVRRDRPDPAPGRHVAGYACFAIVVLGVAPRHHVHRGRPASARTLSFEHVYPTIVSKH